MKIDKNLVKNQFRKCMNTYDDNAFVQEIMAERLVQNIGSLTHQRVLEIGSGTGLLTRKLMEKLKSETLHVNDLTDSFDQIVNYVNELSPSFNVDLLGADAEETNLLPKGLDLIISNASFQWFDDLELFLSNIKTHLNPKGVIAFSTFGPKNLNEIATLTDISLKYISYDNICSTVEKNFDITYSSTDEIVLRFDAPFSVLKHLKNTGVNGVKSTSWGKERISKFEKEYTQRFSEGSEVTLTYEPIIIVAKVK